MKIIEVKTYRPYRVHIGRQLLSVAKNILESEINFERVLIVSDENSVSYARRIQISLGEGELYTLPLGESAKSPECVEAILNKLRTLSFTRGDAVIAVGGGAVSDVTGFACSVYMRGISFVTVPTTLLSAVDAAIGGKNGIDFSGEKNLLGTFWQPRSVIIDCSVISELPDEVFADGMAEVIKYGVLFDKKLFSETMKKPFDIPLEELIAACCEHKANVVSRDEFDEGERHLLNYGHTVAHALEKASGFTLSHGKAVGLGMLITAKGAFLCGYTDVDISSDIARALKKQGLPVKTDILPYLAVKSLKGDKKETGNGIDEIIPVGIGSCKIVRLTHDNLKELVLYGMGAKE